MRPMTCHQLTTGNGRRPTLCLRFPAVITVLTLVLGGCTVHPHGEGQERTLAREAGVAYAPPVEQRVLPELTPEAGPEDLVRYALLANGDLEARYWEWRAAIEQIPMAGTQKTGLELSLQAMLSNAGTGLENITVGIANDGMNALEMPSKLRTDVSGPCTRRRRSGGGSMRLRRICGIRYWQPGTTMR